MPPFRWWRWEYSFGGGATQDPADKSGVGNMVANLLDEGSEDLDSKTFHERLDRRPSNSASPRRGIISAVRCACSRITPTRLTTSCGCR